MGNQQTTAMRNELAQTRRQLQSLRAQNKVMEAERTKEAAARKVALEKAKQTKPLSVRAARYVRAGATVEQPAPIPLTLNRLEDGNVSVPVQLQKEAEKRNLKLDVTQVQTQGADGQPVVYRMYHGLTVPSDSANMRQGFGAQRIQFHKDLIFAIKLDTRQDRANVLPMEEADVKWVWQHLNGQQPQSGAIGGDLRNRMAQSMGRPGVPMPFIDNGPNVPDPYSIRAQLPAPSQSSETIQFRPPSAFPSEQIHFQQIQNR